MKEDAEYEIQITDPKYKVATHEPYVYEDGRRRKLKTTGSQSEKKIYDDKRSTLGLNDLDFHTSFERMTKFVFDIHNSEYEFAPTPIVVNRATDQAGIPIAGSSLEYGKRRNKKRAVITVRGAGSETYSRRKYSLIFVYKGPDGEEELFVLDPVIANGEIDPVPPS